MFRMILNYFEFAKGEYREDNPPMLFGFGKKLIIMLTAAALVLGVVGFLLLIDPIFL